MTLYRVRDTEAHRLTRKAATLWYRQDDWRGGEDIHVTPWSTLSGTEPSEMDYKVFTMWVSQEIMEAVEC